MARDVITDSENVLEYLQISPNILSTFAGRVPVDLYVNDEALNRAIKLYNKDIRLTRLKQEEVDNHCQNGNLFISRGDYRDFAMHLSKNLGALLTETELNEHEAAGIFFIGIRDRLREFFANPINPFLDALKKDIAVFCEYLWVDPRRWAYFFHAMSRENDLADHSTNVLFVGMALYLQFTKTEPSQLFLNKIGLGYLLHDLGMTALPEPLVKKVGPLIFRERSKVKEHIDIGVKILGRLQISDEEVMICCTQHHERLDGSGYPQGMKAHDLNELARIVSIADSFSAMVAKRTYSEPLNPLIAALALIEDEKHYDKDATQLLLKFLVEGSAEIREMFKDQKKVAQLKAMARKQTQK